MSTMYVCMRMCVCYADPTLTISHTHHTLTHIMLMNTYIHTYTRAHGTHVNTHTHINKHTHIHSQHTCTHTQHTHNTHTTHTHTHTHTQTTWPASRQSSRTCRRQSSGRPASYEHAQYVCRTVLLLRHICRAVFLQWPQPSAGEHR